VPKKMTFGPWMLPAFRVLAKFKFLRGTPFDIFGYSEERRTERKLIADYEALLGEIMGKLTPENHHIAVGLANIPEKIRGFGHVKARHLVAAKADEAALLDQFRSGRAPVLKAAEYIIPAAPSREPSMLPQRDRERPPCVRSRESASST
jgi:indolepyruvate ferredoxin oxidoreductase